MKLKASLSQMSYGELKSRSTSEPPDMELIIRTAARYGIEILGPPGIPE
jgi:hypothetical protein